MDYCSLLKNKSITTTIPVLEILRLTCPEGFKNKKNAVLVVNPTVHIISGVIQSLLLLVALYFSFKCNKGFNLGSVLLACCCPICYIAYRLAIPCV